MPVLVSSFKPDFLPPLLRRGRSLESLTILSLVFTVLLMPSLGSAAYLYTSGHGDFRAAYDAANQQFIPHIHLDSGATYTADNILMWTDAARATVTNNATSINRFAGMLGISAGQTVWVMGGSGVGPYLGFSGEGLTASDWIHTFDHPEWEDPVTNSVIHIELTGWSMPTGAHFGAYQTAGLSSVWGNRASGDIIYSTYDPSFTLDNNRLSVAIGDHTHYAFGFTMPGLYELEFTFSSVYQGGPTISTPATFSFLVAPEPSRMMLMAIGLGFCVLRRSRPSLNKHHDSV